jgi:hypothetical protein
MHFGCGLIDGGFPTSEPFGTVPEIVLVQPCFGDASKEGMLARVFL